MAEGRLTSRQIMLLGHKIPSDDMATIAVGYMGFTDGVVRNIQLAKRDDQQAITREIVNKWKCKLDNSGADQIKRLAALLYKAADELELVDPALVEEILEVPYEDAKSATKATKHDGTDTSGAKNTGPDPELTDAMILSVASKITKKKELLDLAIRGLGIDTSEVSVSLTNNSTEITMAAHTVLTQWLKSKANAKVAYEEMVEGLKKAQLGGLIKFLS